MRIVAAPDKFRGTATASQVASAVARAAKRGGHICVKSPVADGGEGTLEALGGPNRTTTVTGPLGDPVEAKWRLRNAVAVIEMAQASGMAIVGGPEQNEPTAASTTGTGELITTAVDSGARKVIVGVGGSASTDGGLGALRAMYPLQRFRGVDLIVACDVTTRFVDAAPVFAPQKGASPAQVKLLTRRLEALAMDYFDTHGVDVREMPGAGAAGGLAGGLAAAGARLVPGFELIAEELDLAGDIADADLVVTGEGFLDEQTFEGKAVGGVIDLAVEYGVRVLVIAGQIFDGVDAALPESVEAISLAERFGLDAAVERTCELITEVVADRMTTLEPN